MLAEGLAKIADIPVVGEEAAFADESVFERLSGACWIVDPLDGTRNFAKGQPPFGILIARASGGETRSGWIYDCLTGRFCAAHLGKGAFVDDERITACPTGEDPPVAAISLFFTEGSRREAVKNAIADYRQVDVPWCAAEQYPRLALGVNDLSFFERTLPWDHAAGALWLNEAGGQCARLDGSPYRVDDWRRKGLLGAASKRLWDAMAEKLSAMPD
jgi:fructose-1,6-bisphosphatase/inositol monophosphatase family enzyme